MTKEEFIKELTKIKVSKTKAELLYKNGFDSIEKLKKASAKDLSKIKGVTEASAKSIIKQLDEKQKKKPAKPKAQKQKTVKAEKTTEEKVKSEVKTEKKEIEKEEDKSKYKAKIKPKLSKELEEMLRIRKQIKNRTPNFLRQEWFRYKKLAKVYRKPVGMTSKMRLHKSYRLSVVRVGFRGPKDTRGLHSSGFEEVMIFNTNDLAKIDPNKQAVRIGGSVGTRKRIDIEKKAKELEIRVLNV